MVSLCSIEPSKAIWQKKMLTGFSDCDPIGTVSQVCGHLQVVSEQSLKSLDVLWEEGYLTNQKGSHVA